MAHLDVRERRIEATIAYLGPDLAGRSTNLHRLGGLAESDRAALDDVVSIEWRPVGLTRFDDCDVSVRVVAPRGPLDDESVQRAVQDADGIVVVLDADPAALERNRQWMDPVRHLLASGDGPPRTVVIQVNKTDLAPPGAGLALVSALDLGKWPHILAAASRGEGVVETVRCALESILLALEGDGASDSAARARTDAHPLLTALRQVLRESVDERIGGIEAQIVSKLEARIDRVEAQIVSKLEARIDGIEAQIVSRLEARIVARLDARAADDREALRSEIVAFEERAAVQTAAATLEQVASLHADFAESAVLVGQLRDDVGKLEPSLRAAVAAATIRDTCRRSDLEAAERRMRDELTTSARGEREHQAASLTALRRAVESLKVDLRPLDHKAEIAAVGGRLEQLSAKLEEAFAVVVPTAAAVRSIPLRWGEAQDRTRNVVLKSVEELGQQVEASLELNRDGGALWARIDQRSAKVEAAVDELLEELKKRKKGWFG